MNAMIDRVEFQLVEGEAVTAWKNGVDNLLADVAIHLACNPEYVFLIVNKFREGNLVFDSSNIPDLNNWFSYYTDDNKLISEIISFYAPAFPTTAEDQPDLLELFATEGPLPHDTDCRAILNAFVPQKNPSLEKLELDWETSPPSMLFFMLVWFPCSYLHGETPAQLLSQAVEGDLKAARKLLQIDKTLMAEPGISKLIQHWTVSGETEKIAKLGSYMGETVANVSLKQIKMTWARFILETSHRRGAPLPAPKIQALFDAIAQDSGLGLLDPDIGEMSPETFAKALKRKEGFWQLDLDPTP